jgi:hypothetical protein
MINIFFILFEQSDLFISCGNISWVKDFKRIVVGCCNSSYSFYPSILLHSPRPCQGMGNRSLVTSSVSSGIALPGSCLLGVAWDDLQDDGCVHQMVDDNQRRDQRSGVMLGMYWTLWRWHCRTSLYYIGCRCTSWGWWYDWRQGVDVVSWRRSCSVRPYGIYVKSILRHRQSLGTATD